MSKSLTAVAADLIALSHELTTLAAIPGLPELFSVRISPDHSRENDPLTALALLAYPVEITELAEIETVQAWATAMNGVLLLADPVPNADSSMTMRRLSAIKHLPNGGEIEVYTWVAKTPVAVLEPVSA